MAIGVPTTPFGGTAEQQSSDVSIAFQRGLRGLTGTTGITAKGMGGEFLRTIGLEEQGNQWLSDAYASGLLMGMDLNELEEQFKGPKTWRDIPDAKGAIAYGVNTLADQMPTLVAQFAPAVAATVLRRFGAPIPKWVTPASVIATIDWLNTSEVYANLLMEAGESRPKVAAGTGALMSSLDMVLPLRVVHRMGNGLDFAKYVGKKLKTPRSPLRTALAGALEGGAIEGTTEYIQTIFENMALNYVKENDLFAEFSAEQRTELEEAGVRGAIVGTFLGGTVSYARAYKNAKDRANLYKKLSAFEEETYVPGGGIAGEGFRMRPGEVGGGFTDRSMDQRRLPNMPPWLPTMPDTKLLTGPIDIAIADKIRDITEARARGPWASRDQHVDWQIEDHKKLWEAILVGDMETSLNIEDQDMLHDLITKRTADPADFVWDAEGLKLRSGEDIAQIKTEVSRLPLSDLIERKRHMDWQLEEKRRLEEARIAPILPGQQRVVAVETQQRPTESVVDPLTGETRILAKGAAEWGDEPTGVRGQRAEEGWFVKDRHMVYDDKGEIKLRSEKRGGGPESRNVYENEKYILRMESETLGAPWIVIDKETNREIDRNKKQLVLRKQYRTAPLAQAESVETTVEKDEKTRLQSQALEKEMGERGAIDIKINDKVRFERFNKAKGEWEVYLTPAVSRPSPLASPELTGREPVAPGTGVVAETYTVEDIWFTSGIKRGFLKRPSFLTQGRPKKKIQIDETKEAYEKREGPVSTVYTLRKDVGGPPLEVAVPPNDTNVRLVRILGEAQKQPLTVGGPIDLAEATLREDELLTSEERQELYEATPEGQRLVEGRERVTNLNKFRELMADEAFYDRFIGGVANAESKRFESAGYNVDRYSVKTEEEIETFIANSNKSRTELGLPTTTRQKEEEEFFARQAVLDSEEKLNEMERLALVRASEARVEGMEAEEITGREEVPPPDVPEGEVTAPLTDVEMEGKPPVEVKRKRRRWREFKEWKQLLRAEEKELGVRAGNLTKKQIDVVRQREWGDKPVGEFIDSTKAEPLTKEARTTIVGKAKRAVTKRLEIEEPPPPRREVPDHLEGVPEGATLLDVIDVDTEVLPAPETHEVKVLPKVAEEHGLNPQYYYPYEVTGWTEHGLIRISGQHIRKEDIVEVRQFKGKAKAPLLEDFVEITDAKQVYRRGAVEAEFYLPDTVPGRETIRKAWIDNTTGIIVVQRDARTEEEAYPDYPYDYEIYLTWHNKEEHALKLKELKDRLLNIERTVTERGPMEYPEGREAKPERKMFPGRVRTVYLPNNKEFLTKDYDKNFRRYDIRVTLKKGALDRINRLRATDPDIEVTPEPVEQITTELAIERERRGQRLYTEAQARKRDALTLDENTLFEVFKVYGERTEPIVSVPMPPKEKTYEVKKTGKEERVFLKPQAPFLTGGGPIAVSNVVKVVAPDGKDYLIRPTSALQAHVQLEPVPEKIGVMVPYEVLVEEGPTKGARLIASFRGSIEEEQKAMEKFMADMFIPQTHAFGRFGEDTQAHLDGRAAVISEGKGKKAILEFFDGTSIEGTLGRVRRKAKTFELITSKEGWARDLPIEMDLLGYDRIQIEREATKKEIFSFTETPISPSDYQHSRVVYVPVLVRNETPTAPPPEEIPILEKDKVWGVETKVVDVPSKEGIDTQIRLDTTVTITHSKRGRMGRQRKQTGKFVEFSYPEEQYFLGGRVKFVSDKKGTRWLSLEDISFVYDETELAAAKEKERLEKRLATIASLAEKAKEKKAKAQAEKDKAAQAEKDKAEKEKKKAETKPKPVKGDVEVLDEEGNVIFEGYKEEGAETKPKGTAKEEAGAAIEKRLQETAVRDTSKDITDDQGNVLFEGYKFSDEVKKKVAPVTADATTKELDQVNTTPIGNLHHPQKFKDNVGSEWQVVEHIGTMDKTILKWVGGKKPTIDITYEFSGKREKKEWEKGQEIVVNSKITPAAIFIKGHQRKTIRGKTGEVSRMMGISTDKGGARYIPNYSVIRPFVGVDERGNANYNTGLTPKRFREVLGAAIGRLKLARLEKDKVLRIVQNQSDVPDPPRGFGIRAVERDGMVWFITNSIEEENITAVFAHELGVHVGILNVYGDQIHSFILASARELRDAEGEGGGIWTESFAAAESIYAKMNANMSPEAKAEFVTEEAIGIYTDATDPMTDSFWIRLLDWLRRGMGRVKMYLGKNLNEAEVVAFIRGAIRGTVDRKFDQAKVRNTEHYSVLFAGLDDKFFSYVNDKLKDNDKEWVDGLVAGGRHFREKIGSFFDTFKYVPYAPLFRSIRSAYQGKLGEVLEYGEDVKKLYTDLSDQDKEEVFKYFTNVDATPEMISNVKLREASVKFKNKIMEIGEEAFKKDIFPEASRAQYEELQGQYLPRIFLAHLLTGKRGASPFGMKASPLYWSETRLELDELRKELLGEVTDPAYLIYRAVTVPQMDMIIIDYLHELSERVAFEPTETIKKLDARLKETRAKIKTEKDEEVRQQWKEELASLLEEKKKIPSGERVVAGIPWVLPGQWIVYKITDPLTGKTRSKRTTVHAIDVQLEGLRAVEGHPNTKPDVVKKAVAEIAKLEALKKEFYDQMGGLDEAAYYDKNYDTKMFRQMPKGRRFGSLAGVWIRKEIYQDIMGNSSTAFGEQNLFSKMFSPHGKHAKLVGIWKTLKVPMNPPTVSRNFVNNTMLLNLFGKVPFHRQPGLFKENIREIWKGERGKIFKNSDVANNYELGKEYTAYELAQHYGLKASTMIASEIREFEDILLSVERDGILSFTMNAQKYWKKAANWSGNMYQNLEVLGKSVYIADALTHQRAHLEEVRQESAGPDGKPTITIEQAAILRANEVLFDYSEVSPTVRGLRSSFFGAPFITYQTKVIPQLLKTALNEPWRFLPYVMMFAGAQAAFGSMPFMDDDWDEFMRLAPEWIRQSGHGMLMPWKDANGNLQVADLSYYFPWSGIWELQGNIRRLELKQGAQEFGLIAPGWQLAVALMQNKDTWRGAQIVDPNGTAADKAMDTFNWMWGMTMPSIITRSGLINMPSVLEAVVRLDPGELEGKLADASLGRIGRYGDPKRDTFAAMASVVGLGIYPIAPDAKRRELRRYESKINRFQRDITRARNDKSLSDKQEARKINFLRDKVDEARRKRKEFSAGRIGVGEASNL